mmetsp:Transcript_9424/g.21265  ORF Transcript_9424/g.21265 Transcript_9424/m.21265 type:complete len:526 (+) Transcript_9424:73-1650(+)
MVVLKRFNQWLGPFMLRNGIRAQALFSRGSPVNDRPFLDSLFGLPIWKKIIALEAREAADQAVDEAQRKLNNANSSSWWSRNLFHLPSSEKKESVENRISLDEESNIRLAVLDAYIRGALVPNETWADVRKWQFNTRLIVWVRREYLFAKYRGHLRSAFQASPSLRLSKQFFRAKSTFAHKVLRGNLPFLPKVTEHSKLPKTSHIRRLFGMENWAEEKRSHSVQRQKMVQLATRLQGVVFEFRGGAWSFAQIQDDTDLSKLSLGEILELARGHVRNCGPFNSVCEEWDCYQLWTQEYVQGLGNYILERAEQQGADETIVLEVGAGDGILAESLRDYFDNAHREQKRHTDCSRRKISKRSRRKKNPTVIATDNYSWPVARNTAVENLSYQEALQKYCSMAEETKTNRHVIVLCSWMPMNQDWSADFRKSHVNEYILIGEYDDGQCGDNWATWGNPHMVNDDLSEELDHLANGGSTKTYQPPAVDPPHRKDGYVRKHLNNLVPFQLSRYDSAVSRNGRTVAFRRSSV